MRLHQPDTQKDGFQDEEGFSNEINPSSATLVDRVTDNYARYHRHAIVLVKRCHW